MPVFDPASEMEQHAVGGSHYGFSATRIDTLGASEYTLVAVVADDSGSVSSFAKEENVCLGQIVEACRKSPRADNLMLRVVRFNGRVDEVHGFKPLPQCNPDDYKDVVGVMGGSTALYDAAHNAVAAMTDYARALVGADFSVNGIVFVLTDGEDNVSTLTAQSVKAALAQATQGEVLESLVSVLVGVNVANPAMSAYLTKFAADAGFTQYVQIDKANAQTLAKLADFVSRSISSQSQALGTGGASRQMTF